MVEHVYIHIPFCHQICTYCDFNKIFIQNQPVDDYLECLRREIWSKAKGQNVKTVFVGGGTPTALNEHQLIYLLETIKVAFPQITVEYTFEANPDELTTNKIALLAQYGVNRLSIGVQTFNNDLLKELGRTHHEEDIFRAIEFAKSQGLTNLSVDLMYRLPQQTMADVEDSVQKVIALDIPHISCYSLIVEPKTVFYNLQRKGLLKLPPEELELEMYQYVQQAFDAQQLKQYEISNFAKQGYESQHNLCYWQNKEYYGFGAGAHGYVDGQRYANFGPLKPYMNAVKTQSHAIFESNEVSTLEKMEEFMFLGLRMLEGVEKALFYSVFNQHISDVFSKQLEKLIARQWLVETETHYKLTREGLYLGNEVFQEFLLTTT